ncbi:MAG: hypothetical protein QM831_25275 [Kofleriaceae bacterium]
MKPIALLTIAACSHADPKPEPAPPPKPPIRDAVGDRDLRAMIAEVASKKACDMIENQFRPLRDKERPDIANGVLWIRTCKLVNSDTKVSLELTGSGWTWADQDKKLAGGKFGVHEYVKFDVTAKLHGAMDVGYDRSSHVASMWFTPDQTPDVSLTPIGNVQVDRESLWARVLGGLGTVTGNNPDKKGTKQAGREGTNQMRTQLGDGMSLTVDLCTGLPRIVLGRPPKGQMGAADAGESGAVPIEMHPGGLMVLAPQLAPDGMSVKVDTNGPVRVGLACQKDAEAVADAFVHDRPVEPRLISDQLVAATTTLKVKAQRCPVTVVAQSTAPVNVTFDVARPATEIATSVGGPMINCKKG